MGSVPAHYGSPSSITWGRAIVAAVVPYIVCTMPVFLTATLAIRLREDLHFDEARLGALLAMFAVGGAVASPSAGRLAERIGPGPSLRLACASSGIVTIAIAIGARSWGQMAALVAVSGIVTTFMMSANNLWLARALGGQKMGLAFGIKQSGGPAAAMLAGLAVPTLAATIGWRWTFATFGMFAVLASLTIPRGVSQGSGRSAPSRVGDLALTPMVVLTVGVGVSTAAASAFTGFAVTASVYQAGISESVAGLIFATGAAVGIMSRVSLGRWIDGRPGAGFEVPAAMVAAGALGFLALATGSRPAFLVAVPFGFATAWGWVGLFHHALTRVNVNAPAAATGIIMVGTNLGVVTGPFVFGLVSTHSFRAAWLVNAAGSLLGATALMIGQRLVHRESLGSTSAQ